MSFAFSMLFLCLVPGTWAVPDRRKDGQFNNNDTIVRGVIIIGGGSSETYSALSLNRQGYTVALVEKEPILGGHVNTYRYPVRNQRVDFGVLVLGNLTVVLDYFHYLDVSLAPLGEQPRNTFYANFSGDGKFLQIPDSIPWANDNTGASALVSYLDILVDYPYLANWFNLPYPVPEDLNLSWGTFLNKYNLYALAFFASNSIEGSDNVLEQPALYVMKWFGQLVVNSLLGNGVQSLTTENHDNQGLYEKASTRLGRNAFASSNVTAIERDNGIVKSYGVDTIWMQAPCRNKNFSLPYYQRSTS
jgi:monoamine oxidase